MLRLLFLLIGGPVLRKLGPWLTALGFLSASASLGIASDLLQHGNLSFPLHVLAVFLTIEGLAEALSAIYSPSGIAWPLLAKSAMLMLFSAAVYLAPHDSSLPIFMVFALIFLLDGGFRIIACCLIRCRRWRHKLTLGVAEMLFCVMIATRWPLPPHVIVPLCFAFLLAGWALTLLSMAQQIRNLPEHSSVAALPLFTRKGLRAPHGFDYVHPPLTAQTASTPLNIYIWTPLGSGAVRGRRPWFDRWVAAIDHHGNVSTGHTSLEMGEALYISFYPVNDVSINLRGFLQTLRGREEFDVPGFHRASLEQEIKALYRPDKRFSFVHYNQVALRNFWLSNASDTRYNLTSRNCSTHVIQALDVATEGVLGTQGLKGFRVLFNPDFWLLSLIRSRAEGMTWTPGLVMDYCMLLRRVMEAAGGHGHYGRTLNWMNRAIKRRWLTQEPAQRSAENTK